MKLPLYFKPNKVHTTSTRHCLILIIITTLLNKKSIFCLKTVNKADNIIIRIYSYLPVFKFIFPFILKIKYKYKMSNNRMPTCTSVCLNLKISLTSGPKWLPIGSEKVFYLLLKRFTWFQDKRRSPKRRSGQTQEC